jgi:iron complex outermembrane recepter protein
MRIRRHAVNWLGGACGATVLMTSAVAQQTTAAPAAGEATDALQEIVVTAERHEETSQTTPVAMSVYSGKDIADAGVHDISTLTTIDPSVNFTTATGSGYIAIRGVSSTDLTEIGDPAVSVSRDGFFTNRSYGLFSSFYDVDRVEVLKGPQGTLYGRNSSGGVINILSATPTNTFGGYVSIDAGDYQALNFEGALNLPLSDTVQMRISGVSLHHDAYRDNAPAERGADDEDSRSVRVQLAFEPFDTFKGLVSVQRDNTDDVGDAAAIGPYETVYTVPDSTRFPIYTQPSNRLVDTRYRGNFTWSLPADLTLTYLGGYDHTEWHHATDETPYPPTTYSQFLQNENPNTQNHELRLASADTGRLFWQGGLFYFSEINSPLDSAAVEESGPFDGQDLISFHYAVRTTSKAAFAHATFKVTDQIKISAGARYTEDHKVRTGDSLLDLNVATGGAVPPGPPIVTLGNGDITSSKTTFHTGIEWTPTDTNMLYAKYDTGYKAGGFNSAGTAPSVPYGPETVEATEIGSKNRFLNDTLQANVDVFRQIYKGYQATEFTPLLGSGSSEGVQNAGDALIYGAEGELQALLKGLAKLDLEVTYLHARFENFSVVDASGALVPIGGDSLPNSPDFTATMGLEHSWNLPQGVLTARINGKYESKFNFNFINYADLEQKNYATGDFSVRYNPPKDGWELQAYVRNFTNTVYWAYAFRNAVALANNYEFAPPRTYGLRLRVNF